MSSTLFTDTILQLSFISHNGTYLMATRKAALLLALLVLTFYILYHIFQILTATSVKFKIFIDDFFNKFLNFILLSSRS